MCLSRFMQIVCVCQDLCRFFGICQDFSRLLVFVKISVDFTFMKISAHCRCLSRFLQIVSFLSRFLQIVDVCQNVCRLCVFIKISVDCSYFSRFLQIIVFFQISVYCRCLSRHEYTADLVYGPVDPALPFKTLMLFSDTYCLL